MQQQFSSRHDVDGDGSPDGGYTIGQGLVINWQKGPLSVDGYRKEPNGSFVETVIAAAIDRLKFYQDSRFKCDYNRDAIVLLERALESLAARTADREARGVEGTHKI